MAVQERQVFLHGVLILIEQSADYCKMAQSRISGVEEWRNPSSKYVSQSLFEEEK